MVICTYTIHKIALQFIAAFSLRIIKAYIYDNILTVSCKVIIWLSFYSPIVSGTVIVIAFLVYLPEDGHTSSRNMLDVSVWLNYN